MLGVPQANDEGVLLQAGHPAYPASFPAGAEARAAEGALLDEDRAMTRPIGRSTTSMTQIIAAAVRQR